MQVFKSFFKVLNKYMGQMIMYMCIFCSLLIMFIKSNSGSKTDYYSDIKCEFAVFDYDSTIASRELISYLAETNTIVGGRNNETVSTEKSKLSVVSDDNYVIRDEKSSMQDALYNREVDAIIRIPEGFEEKLLSGEANGVIDVITIPGTQNSMLVEADLDGFLGMLEMYIKSGYSMEDAVEKAKTALAEMAAVSLPDGKNVSAHSSIYMFFNYLGWVMLCLIITGVSSVLQVFGRKELKDRIECSSYNFLNFNKELVLGMVTTGGMICSVFFVISVFFFKGQVFSFEGGMYILNMLCYAVVCLSIAFLVSKLTSKKEILSMIANVVSLGMAFLCGIFVPVEFLGEGVVRVAHFLPAYWYNQAAFNIDFHMSERLGSIFADMGIQILFAVAILVIGMVADRRRTE